MPSATGNLTWVPLSHRLDLVAEPVRMAVSTIPDAQVAEIDPALADTRAFCAAYDVSEGASANCVLLEGRRAELVRQAAVLVLATDRADVNGVVRRHLGLRSLSFMDAERAELLTGMEHGGITPIGLPPSWALLVDDAVAAVGPVVVGAGRRSAKILLDGAALGALPGAEVLSLTRSP